MTEDERRPEPAPPPGFDEDPNYTPPALQTAIREIVAKTLMPLPRPLRIVVVTLISLVLVVVPVLFLAGILK